MLGHQFLLQEFGVVPTIGWQIDPFGHANAQVNLTNNDNSNDDNDNDDGD